MAHMNDTIVRLVKPQLDWHIIELISLLSPGPLAEQTAELLICDHLAAHCPDMANCLAKWMRVLKPNGWLVAAFLTPHYANDRITFFLTGTTLVGRLEAHNK